jgi:hypothetical protein
MATGARRKNMSRGSGTTKQMRAISVQETHDLADKLLARYGEPSLSLSELRHALDKQIPGIMLSEFIIKERET